MSSTHINRLKSMNLSIKNEKQKENDTVFDFGFLNVLHQMHEHNSSDDDKMKRSQSLRNFDQNKIEKEQNDVDADYSCRFIDFLPEFQPQILKLDQLQILNPYPTFKK